MTTKCQPTSRPLEEINKLIIEIKKKIQLSEGQRKAAFEEYETERKQNADQILKLKKEIKELTVSLHRNKDETAEHRIQGVRLENIVGPLSSKTTEQVKHNLDLHIIDNKKQLDLIKHRIKERQKYMAILAEEYQELISLKPKQEVEKMDNPFKKGKRVKVKKEKKLKSPDEEIASPYKERCYEIQNNIHRVEVQWREAEHVRTSYRTIKGSLLKDRACFESTLQDLEEKKQQQQKDIQELQRMNSEASVTRTTARQALDREERSSVLSSRVRERQAAETAALVASRRQELERLQRRVFQSGKPVADNTDSAQVVVEQDEEEETTSPESEDTEKVVMDAFDRLKDATGATSSHEVLIKFQAQKDTKGRLDYLKKTTEAEKKQLEKRQQALYAELERYKFAQERDKEKFSDELLNLQQNIDLQIERQATISERSKSQQSLLQTICKSLHNLYLSLKDIGVKPLKNITPYPEDCQLLVDTLAKELQDVVERNAAVEVEQEGEIIDEEERSEEEMMPMTYNALLRRTPLPQQGHIIISTPLQSGPEDEEEVPSRGFLKRQAQLVVDAKSRRKALRIPMNRK